MATNAQCVQGFMCRTPFKNFFDFRPLLSKTELRQVVKDNDTYSELENEVLSSYILRSNRIDKNSQLRHANATFTICQECSRWSRKCNKFTKSRES